MKKITLLFILCASAFIGTSQIDATINPIGLLFGNFSVGGDYIVNDNLSVELSAGFGGKSEDDEFTGSYKYRNVGINAFGKYYFSPDNGGDKFYTGVFLRYINRNYEYENDGLFDNSDYKQSRIGGGFLTGYKVVSDGGFVFDINLGVGKAFSDNTEFSDSDGTETTIEWPTIMFTGKIGVGYRFGS